MEKKDILFVCVHNSARSQIAEEYVKRLSNGALTAESAGFKPGTINPLVVEAMKEEGIDLSEKTTQSVFELFKKGNTYKAVVTVCDESEGGNCPIFPGMTHRLHLPFPDPAELEGTHDEKMRKIREIRNQIKNMVQELLSWLEHPDAKRLGDHWEIKSTS
ncbi:arsenate reductase ArsC [Desulfovibrio inopinatus]|uniref:arsenate reductase ArsC n=1 Tax=Desulfovibrio inopinatus TaxID=102109 RepID=UPI0003FF30C4|nr:arsenate reductase ArsC [Desulfovibrio inopinatus]